MKKTELVFIPAPGMGHLVSTVEMAKVLVARDERLSITILIINLPSMPSHTQPLLSGDASQRIRAVELPQDPSLADLLTKTSLSLLNEFIEAHKPYVRDVVSEMIAAPGSQSAQLGGFVIDMFCTSMVEVADDFGVPTYVFFTTGAGVLGLMFHVQTLQDEHNQGVTELKDSDAELSVPAYANPVPAKVLPSSVVDKELGNAMFLKIARNMRKTKGIVVNTFAELESHAVKCLSVDDSSPPIYPVGPVLNLKSEGPGRNHQFDDIMEWLDNQPPSSVVFLCFGSMGSFDGEQVKEIARALERSGHRFLWSLRRPPPKGNVQAPGDYENPAEVLPQGFLERTAAIGKVIGWAPQVAVLSHVAVGGFVSHCGWNSTLESLWCGMPVATWPLFAEQQMNAFQLAKELGLSVEIKMDFRKDFRTGKQEILTAEEIESGLRRLMEGDDHQSRGEIKRKVKEMSEKSKAAVMEGGSSYNYIGCFIKNVIDNAPPKLSTEINDD